MSQLPHTVASNRSSNRRSVASNRSSNRRAFASNRPSNRRYPPAAMGVVALVVALLGGCAPARSAAGRSPAVSVVRLPVEGPAPSGEPPRAWIVPLGRQPSAIAADRDGLVVGVGFREVVAADPGGRVRWRLPVRGIGYERPALDHDAVLVAADERFVPGGSGGEVVLADRATGEQRWSAATSPLAAVALGPRLAYAVTVDGTVTAYDRATGEPVWVQRLPGEASVAGNLALTREGTRPVVATVWRGGDGAWGVDALDATTGALAWRHDLGEPGAGAGPPSAAVAAGDAILVGDGTQPALRAFDAADGRPRWSVGTADVFDPANVPAIDGRLVVAVDRSGEVVAVDVATGIRRWHTAVHGVVLDGRPALTPRLAAVATWEGELALLDRADGRVVWRGVPGGIPVGLAALGDLVVGSVRLGDPPRVEAWGPSGAG